MADITQNPDYQLVMKFLQNIRPGDMDQESSEQLMMIGQRIEAGGALSDREREMFEAVVGATDRFPVEQMDSFPQGGTNPDLMRQSTGAAMTPRETTGAAMTDEERMSYQVDGGMEKMTPSQMAGMQSSGAITPTRAPSNVMSMDDAIAAGLVNPTRPQARPTAPMQSMRPQARPMRQEAIMAEVNVENMEENAVLFEKRMGFPHTEAGLDLTDEQLVNFLLLCLRLHGVENDGPYYEGVEEEDMDYHDDDEEMMEMPHGKDVKVKVMKLDGSNVHEMMNKLLGG